MKSILLLLTLSYLADCVQVIEGFHENDIPEIEVEDKLAKMLPNKTETEGAYPPNHSLDVADVCSCRKILLSSLGPAATYLPHVMGTYTKSYTSYNGKPAYRQNYGNDYRMYFLPRSGEVDNMMTCDMIVDHSGWLIGDNRGAPTGYIHNSDLSQQCPYTIPSGWMFYSSQHGSWYPDNTLVLRCINP